MQPKTNIFDKIKIPLLFLGITVLLFILGLIATFAFWGVLALLEVETDFFAMVEALSTALAAAAVFGAGYLAYQELSESAKSRHVDVADKLFDELNSPENIKARKTVYGFINKSDKSALTKTEEATAKQVLNSLDRVAFLTQAGWIPNEDIMPWMHPMIYKSWKALEPYVVSQRKTRQEPYFYEHAEELAQRCLKWRQKHNIPDEFHFSEKAW